MNFTTSKSSAIVIPITATTKTTAPNSFEEFKEAWQLQIAADKSLPAGSLRVALALSAHMNRRKNGLAWPGYRRLQKMLGIHRATVIRNIKRLEKAGYLSVERRRNGSKNAPNHYWPELKDASKGGAQNATTLVAQLCDSPSSTGATTLVAPVRPEPLNEPPSEPLTEPLPDTAAVNTAAKGFTNDSANSVKRESGSREEGITLTSSDNPSSSSQRSHRSKGAGASGLFSEHWFLAGDSLNTDGGRRR